MKPAPFEYCSPRSLDEAIALLALHGEDAKILAGGQTLVPMMNLRFAQPRRIVDINRLPNLDYIRSEGSEVAIGALVRHNSILESDDVRRLCPLLTEAYALVANPTVRNRGTLCGNLAHGDPASEMPAVMLALDATLIVRGEKGTRKVPAREFFIGLYTTAIRTGELLVEVRVPVIDLGTGYAIEEMAIRKGDFALAAAVATMTIESSRVVKASLAFCGVTDRAVRLPAIDAKLIGARPSRDLFAAVGAASATAIDIRADSEAELTYRRDLLRVLTARALSTALDRATQESRERKS